MTLLERRETPRYEANPPGRITIDAVVDGTIMNASETGLAIATPYRPVLNSIVPIRIQLPNLPPCDARAQVIWSGNSGIGVKLLEPARFRAYFENWRAFTTEVGSECDEVVGASEEVPNTEAEDNTDWLRAALEDNPDQDSAAGLRTFVVAAAVTGALLAVVAVWAWHTHRPPTTLLAAADNEAAAPATVADNEAIAPTTVLAPPAVMPTTAQPTTRSAPAVPSAAAHPQAREGRTETIAHRHENQPTRRPRAVEIVVTVNRFDRVSPKVLRDPDRIYFDLSPGTNLRLPSRSYSGNTLLRRMRVGRARDGRTRVVLDLYRSCEYEVKVSRTRPHQLTIRLWAGHGRRVS